MSSSGISDKSSSSSGVGGDGSSSSGGGGNGNESLLGPRVLFMLQQLGIEVGEESLHYIAINALSDLPKQWQIVHDRATEGYYFMHKHSREISEHHPLLDDYLELVQEERSKSMVRMYVCQYSKMLYYM